MEIPLNAEGRLTDIHRLNALSTRKVDLYRSVYLEPWVKNLTQFYRLPKPGLLDLHCLVPASAGIDPGELEENIGDSRPGAHPALWILPETPADQLGSADKNRPKPPTRFCGILERGGRPIRSHVDNARGHPAFLRIPCRRKESLSFKNSALRPGGRNNG